MTGAIRSHEMFAMFKVYTRRIAAIVAALLVAVSAAPPCIVLGHQRTDTPKKDDAISKPTAEQAAAHRQTLERRHVTFKAALAKARADTQAARTRFLDKQRAALDAENAKVMAEIARRRGESPEPQEP